MVTNASARVETFEELRPLEGAVSSIWKYFRFPAQNSTFMEYILFQKMQIYLLLCGELGISYSCFDYERMHVSWKVNFSRDRIENRDHW